MWPALANSTSTPRSSMRPTYQTKQNVKNDRSVNNALMWEMIKLKIREHSLKYSAIKAKTSRLEENLEKEI